MKKLIMAFALATLMTTGVMTKEVNAAPKKVKVTYVENGGKTVKDQTVTKNTNPTEPSITKSGYSFSGWYTDKALTKKWNTSSKVTKNTTLYAKWSIPKYTVSYDTRGGNTLKSTQVTRGSNLVEPTPKKTNYNFLGWYTDTNCTKIWDSKNGKVTKNMTLYAKWEKAAKASDFVIENGVLKKYKGSATHVTVPNGVTRIDEFAFDYNSVANVKLPNSVTHIDKNAFACQKYLANITLSSNLTTIGDDAFIWCSELESITLPSKLTSIGKEAFYGINIKKINIPSSVTFIGDDAFNRYGYRNNRVVPVLNIKNNTYAAKWAYDNGYRHTVNGSAVKKGKEHLIIGGYYVRYCGTSSTVVVPEGVLSIGKHAFAGNDYVKTVKMPSTLTWIWDDAFNDAPNLKNINIPEGVTTIGNSAFWGTNITTLNLPSSLNNFGDIFGPFTKHIPIIKITNNDYAVKWAKINGFSYYHNGVFYDKATTKSKTNSTRKVTTSTTEPEPKESLALEQEEQEATTNEEVVTNEEEQEKAKTATKKEQAAPEEVKAEENNEVDTIDNEVEVLE